MIHVCTCAAVNYLPKVRLLSKTLKRHHPEFSIHLALADRWPDWLDIKTEPFDNLITLEQLGVPNLKSWLFRYSIIELSTAMKPFALRYLLSTPGCEAVLYLDPDIAVFSRLDDLIASFKEGSILLTPHQTKPEQTMEAIIDNEICSLKYGIFNLGFIGVKNDANARNFLDWWCERVDKFCYEALEDGLWVDQKWVNFAAVFFEGVKILKSSRFNVAPWNITTRRVTGSITDGLMVDGEPLGFYHFTGFDSGAHKVMAAKYGSDNPAVMSMVKWYEESIGEDKSLQNTRWGYDYFDNGKPITKAHRLIYRIRKDLQEAYPDPFRAANLSDSYYTWFELRARVEHPEVFKARVSNAVSFTRPITGKVDWSRVRYYLKLAATNNKLRGELLRKSWSIFRREGFRGLKRRLR